jgi:integrase
MSLARLDTPAVLKIRDKAYETRKRRFANFVLEVLRLVFSWSIPPGYVNINPAKGIKKIPRPKELEPANRAWTDEECEIVLGHATGGLKVAIALGMFAALRIGMAVRITWTAYDNEAIHWRQKTDASNWLPAHAELRKILDTTPKIAATMVVSAMNRHYQPSGLAKAFQTLIKNLIRDQKLAPGLTFHGLPHTAGKTLADLGCDPRTIAAMLGHKSLTMAIHYSEQADRRLRATAAVHSLEQARNARVSNSQS